MAQTVRASLVSYGRSVGRVDVAIVTRWRQGDKYGGRPRLINLA
jgi:hypothetical protein